MAATYAAPRYRIGALVCSGAFVLLNLFFLAGNAFHDRQSTIGVCIVDAILLTAAMMLYRRSRRLRPANPLAQYYRVD
jgi:hypothetical protein